MKNSDLFLALMGMMFFTNRSFSQTTYMRTIFDSLPAI